MTCLTYVARTGLLINSGPVCWLLTERNQARIYRNLPGVCLFDYSTHESREHRPRVKDADVVPAIKVHYVYYGHWWQNWSNAVIWGSAGNTYYKMVLLSRIRGCSAPRHVVVIKALSVIETWALGDVLLCSCISRLLCLSTHTHTNIYIN